MKFRYPGFVNKALSFTIDDGNLTCDARFIDIVKPAGIKGTFNLCSDRTRKEQGKYLREFYRGFEIANHCKFHPFAFEDEREYKIFPANAAEGAEPSLANLYEIEGRVGMYKFLTERGWREIASTELYIKCADESRLELEEIFGEGSVGSFVWPYCEQKNRKIKEHLNGQGYYGIRKTGDLLDSTGFSLPSDWYAWSYNASNRNLLEVMEKYERYNAKDELKCFIFGVHSWDFERDGNWGDLVEFADKYGNRQGDFWYATVGEIYDYSKAIASLKTENGRIVNDSAVELFLELDGGEKISLLPGESRSLK